MSEISAWIRLVQSDSKLLTRLDWFCRQPGCEWKVTRGEEGEPPALIIRRQGVFLTDGDKQLLYHPSMAMLRMIHLLQGKTDRFLEAVQLRPGDFFLDATLGWGSDALLGAWAVGEEGRVLALEQSPVLAAFVGDGLRHFTEIIPVVKNLDKQQAWAVLGQAAQGIEIHWGEHGASLKGLPANSVDVVYFDPMFRQALWRSGSVAPLRRWSGHSSLAREAVQEACRVARKRVVLKERKGSEEFRRLGFALLPGGRYSSVDYGVIRLE